MKSLAFSIDPKHNFLYPYIQFFLFLEYRLYKTHNSTCSDLAVKGNIVFKLNNYKKNKSLIFSVSFLKC